jgi:NAD(P)-dependent dehydrogenase (short-subunit alcohol dehydrogenase family)
LAFARYGASGLFVADINEQGVQETAKQAKQVATNPEFSVHARYVDVRSYQSVEKLFAEAVSLFKKVDYSVTTAGVRHLKTGSLFECTCSH